MIGGSILKVLGIEQTVKTLGGLFAGSAGTIFGHLVGIHYTVNEAVDNATTPDPVPTSVIDAISQLSSTLTLVLGAVAVLALIVFLRR